MGGALALGFTAADCSSAVEGGARGDQSRHHLPHSPGGRTWASRVKWTLHQVGGAMEHLLGKESNIMIEIDIDLKAQEDDKTKDGKRFVI